MDNINTHTYTLLAFSLSGRTTGDLLFLLYRYFLRCPYIILNPGKKKKKEEKTYVPPEAQRLCSQRCPGAAWDSGMPTQKWVNGGCLETLGSMAA